MVSYSKFEQEFSYGRKYVEPLSTDYVVYVNGEKIPVYTCRVSKVPFNRIWPGHQREINQSELASFVNIVGDEKIDIKVVVNIKHDKVSIRPFSKQVAYSVTGNEVTFSLEKEGHFVLTGDDLHQPLYLYYTKPIVCPNPEEVTHYFGPGIHMTGKIVLHDNDTVYVDKDALVYGCVFARDAKNIRIFGNGVFDDSAEERITEKCYEGFTNGNVKFYNCENVEIEGVAFKNSAIWCVNIFECQHVKMDRIKVFGQWRYNTDGVDIVNSRDVTLTNSFVHTFDDSVTIKGIQQHRKTNCEDIFVENCILWCDWGRACELGLETFCKEFKNITFKNCDVIRAGDVAIDIQNGHCAEISNILYENINVELNSFDNAPIIQKDDASVYEGYGESHMPFVIFMQNFPMHAGFYKDHCDESHKGSGDLDMTGIMSASVHHVIVRNVNVFCDEQVEKNGDRYRIRVKVESVREGVDFHDIRIEGLKVNGVPYGMEDVELTLGDVKNFSFE